MSYFLRMSSTVLCGLLLSIIPPVAEANVLDGANETSGAQMGAEVENMEEVPFEEVIPDFEFELMDPMSVIEDHDFVEDMVPEANAQAEVPVQCKGNLDYPHLSHHVTGTVNAQARIQCQTTLTFIKGTVTLTRDSVTTASSGEVTKRNTRKWKANAALNCIRRGEAHRYKAMVKVTWQAPPNHRPDSGEHEFTKEKSVNC